MRAAVEIGALLIRAEPGPVLSIEASAISFAWLPLLAQSIANASTFYT